MSRRAKKEDQHRILRQEDRHRVFKNDSAGKVKARAIFFCPLGVLGVCYETFSVNFICRQHIGTYRVSRFSKFEKIFLSRVLSLLLVRYLANAKQKKTWHKSRLAKTKISEGLFPNQILDLTLIQFGHTKMSRKC